MTIVNTNWAVSPAGNSYSFEFGTNRLGVQFVKVVRSLTNTNPSGHLYRNIPTSLYKDCYCVTYYRWDHTKSSMPLCSMTRVVVFVSRRLLDDALAYAIRCNDNKFNPGDVLNMINSLHKREITNGVSIKPRKTDEHLTLLS